MPKSPNSHRQNITMPVHGKQRKTANRRGYDATWQKLRLIVLADEPLCRSCKKEDRLIEAREVDHIIPMSNGGARLDRNNLQSLCKSCHSKKTANEDGGFGGNT